VVQISPIQAQTISAEAAAYIAATNPLPIPVPPGLTPAVADAINAQLDAVTGPFLDGLRRTLRHAFTGVPGIPEGEQAMAEVFGFLDRHL
jgi:hypothetical protein